MTEYIYFLPSFTLFFSYVEPVSSHYRCYPLIRQLLSDCRIPHREARFICTTLRPLDDLNRAAVASVYAVDLYCWLDQNAATLLRPVRDFLGVMQERIALYGVDNIIYDPAWDWPVRAYTYSMETCVCYLAFVNHIVPEDFLTRFLTDEEEDSVPISAIMDCIG